MKTGALCFLVSSKKSPFPDKGPRVSRLWLKSKFCWSVSSHIFFHGEDAFITDITLVADYQWGNGLQLFLLSRYFFWLENLKAFLNKCNGRHKKWNMDIETSFVPWDDSFPWTSMSFWLLTHKTGKIMGLLPRGASSNVKSKWDTQAGSRHRMFSINADTVPGYSKSPLLDNKLHEGKDHTHRGSSLYP